MKIPKDYEKMQFFLIIIIWVSKDMFDGNWEEQMGWNIFYSNGIELF